MNLQFTRRAQRDLSRLRAFIAKNNPAAARRRSQRLRAAIKHLLDHPDLGVDVPELEGVRDLKTVDGEYIVRYTRRDDAIIVLQIWHTKEDI